MRMAFSVWSFLGEPTQNQQDAFFVGIYQYMYNGLEHCKKYLMLKKTVKIRKTDNFFFQLP